MGKFHVRYEDSSTTSGDYFTDTLMIGGSKITDFTMGLGTDGSNIIGVFGIGYSWGETSILNTDKTPYPNCMDAMVKAGVASSHGYSLWLDDLGDFLRHHFTFQNF